MLSRNFNGNLWLPKSVVLPDRLLFAKGKSLPLAIREKLFRKSFIKNISGDTLRANALLAVVSPNECEHSNSLLNNIGGFYAANARLWRDIHSGKRKENNETS